MSTKPMTEPSSAATVFEQIANGDAELLREHAQKFRQQVEAEAQLIRAGAADRLVFGPRLVRERTTSLQIADIAE